MRIGPNLQFCWLEVVGLEGGPILSRSGPLTLDSNVKLALPVGRRSDALTLDSNVKRAPPEVEPVHKNVMLTHHFLALWVESGK